MKHIVKYLILCLVIMLFLASCGTNQTSDVPEGYVLASIPQQDGFSLYVPDGWTTYYTGDILQVYVSSVDRSSLSVATVDSALTPKEYFEASRSGFEQKYTDFTIVEQDEAQLSGKDAFHVFFTATYQEIPYGFRQAIIDGGDGLLFVLTCSAENVTTEQLPTSRLAQHQKDFVDIVAYFTVTGKPQERPEPTFACENTPQGMKCAGDETVLGCHFFVPESYTISISDGAVMAVAEDGSNVQLMPLQESDYHNYLKSLLDQYKKIYQNITVICAGDTVEYVGEMPILRLALTLEEDGVLYHVEQHVILAHKGVLTRSYYLLTFVAKAENKDAHTAEWQKIEEALAHS